MIEIYPKLTSSFSKCPACGCQLSTPSSLLFIPKYVLANIECSCCDVWYYHSYPAKNKEDPSCFAFTKDGKHITFNSSLNKWNLRALIKDFKNRQKRNIGLEIEIRQHSGNVTLVNLIGKTQKSVIDLLENIQLRIKDTSNLIIVISDPFKHLVPELTSEVWILRDKSNVPSTSLTNFNELVQKQFSRFNQISIFDAEYHLPLKNNVSVFEKFILLLQFGK